MWTYPETYHVIVVGAGHAGCEAAYASARMGEKTLLLTMNLDTIGKMSCNPAIGGTAKGHLTREIDALGGVQGKVADRSAIHFKMLNASKGPAVWSPRAQTDKCAFQKEMKGFLEGVDNLFLMQGTIEELIVEGEQVRGVRTREGIAYLGKTVILSAGTFMKGLIHIGGSQHPGGRAGDMPSIGLSKHLCQLGFQLGRLKTGTPPRIHARSIDFARCELQEGERGRFFSFDGPPKGPLPQIACHITYTSEQTKQIILENMHRCPLYTGEMKGTGTRYCPSIEEKVKNFPEKERHQIFLEPEGLDTSEVYVNGISTSLPFDVQLALLTTIAGLEQAEIMRPAYAIEYDYLVCGQIDLTLQSRAIGGLYFAGQINGTTGYEEAAAQGLMAGINASLRNQAKPPFILKRSEAYIGVMIDELISKEHTEPYRMFTSRAEHRLVLRQDNADMRLRRFGHQLGLVSDAQLERLDHKEALLTDTLSTLEKTYKDGVSLAKVLKRPGVTYAQIAGRYGLDLLPEEVVQQVELQLKYAGYIARQQKEIEKLRQLEDVAISFELDYASMMGLGNEARDMLEKVRPFTLGQASRLAGVTPADLSILMVALKQRSKR